MWYYIPPFSFLGRNKRMMRAPPQDFCNLAPFVQCGEDDPNFIAARPHENHPVWGDQFFQFWGPLLKVNFFTDEDKAA